ncbi:BspA family leucine-rich repeat surface protein [Helicobacter sp. 23-1046]
MNKFTPKDKKELIRLIVGGISLDKIDTTLITDMSDLFEKIRFILWEIEMAADSDTPFEWQEECLTQEFFNGIEDWNTSNVVDMSCMFSGCKYFNSDISKWDTSKVENMHAMFAGAESFNQPLNDWNVSNVEARSRMFVGAKSFNQSLENWNIKEVRVAYGIGKVGINFDLLHMFEGCPLESNPPKWWKKYTDPYKIK